ncbi:S-methyl-5-thioribose kinase [Gluconacetobacter entanii]|uniref:S-methyl-5-thioribose kinase n=1 Tax=Gluconacetobacter entanii TaxID=108528 RepID=UPI001C93627E|nr:S-methyl-5-thioribose kinase [Gluconacetobacter entanii]MBY4640976.1 S-methyl-5-thioribose kinase [Gluconacetobacter entanii]MCW4579062.1 S-methyl-5-thioribose kinase [Gluconacetobacter entanii]MCW4582463.1 S-methyl-5-thioribose kinase [Gluconacetobacter entanii]MCW4585846.1 S-methyl-5-thioribose kinase [Gluconacetobacter entanii]
MNAHAPPNAPRYRTLDMPGILAFLSGLPDLAARLGGTRAQWTIREVSDGNLNNVFVVDGPRGGVCVKQSLPHVRVDPSWKMPLDRTFFEASYLRDIHPLVPGLTTRCLHFDPDLFVLVVESLAGHAVYRTVLMSGVDWPRVVPDIATFVARATFGTSVLSEPFERVFDRHALYARNQTLQRITLDLVLDDPYHDHPRNHWDDVRLDDVVGRIRTSPAVRRAVDALRLRFLTCPQALLHGDLHTGSIMATATDTRVIDGEFAIYGPIGFDCGMFVGNLVLRRFADLSPDAGRRCVAEIARFWDTFVAEFTRLWAAAHPTPSAMSGPCAFFVPDADGASPGRTAFVRAVFDDMVGYCAMEIIRRIIGYAHTADFDVIPTHDARTERRRAALSFACGLLDAHGAQGDVEAAFGALVREDVKGF